MHVNLCFLIKIAPLISAIGTIVVSILAIYLARWGDKIKLGPILSLEEDFGGEETILENNSGESEKAIFYHLKVINKQKGVEAKNVKVLCKGLWLVRSKDGKQELEREKIVVPQQFTWAPAEFSPTAPTIAKDHALDLGFVTYRDGFRLRFYVYPNNKYWIIKPGETKIVGMEIYADKYSSEKSYMFKITLTKAENDDYKDLRQSVDIKQISSLQEGVR